MSEVKKNVATWTNKDKSLSVQIVYSSIEELVRETYKLSLVDGLGDVKTDADLFKALNEIGNVDSVKDEPCGKCGGHNISYRARDVDGNIFYEKVCTDCWAKLSFGAHKKPAGSLFGKRKGEDGSKLPSNGWLKYDKETGKNS